MNDNLSDQRAAIKAEYINLISRPGAKRADVSQLLADKYYRSQHTINILLPAVIRQPYRNHDDDLGKESKHCIKCGELKPLSCFNFHPGTKDGHFGTCKDCKRAEEKERNLKRPKKGRTGRRKLFLYP